MLEMVQLRKPKARLRATRVFTDRKSPQKAFSDLLEKVLISGEVKSEKDSVITFYGIGGVGKTRLKKELIQLCNQTSNKFVVASANFALSELDNTGRFLCELLGQFEEQGVKFPHFKIAYSIYFAKKNPDTAFNEQSLPFIEESGLVSTLISSIDGFGVLGAAKDLVNQVYKLYTKTLALDTKVKVQLEELVDTPLEDIEECLTSFFNYDLERFCSDSGHFPIVFIDTYEAVLKNQETMRSHWLRNFVDTSENTLFTLLGRDKIQWTYEDSMFSRKLEQHLLENLSKEDSYAFLQCCGVEEQTLKDKIYELSLGHPFLLDLSVDTFDELRRQGKANQLCPSKFGKSKVELFQKFQQYISKDEINLLKLLSVPNYFDSDVFDLIVKEFSFSHMVDAEEQLLRFSFITEEHNTLFVHRLMRENLLSSLTEKYRNRVHTLLLAHYQHFLKKLDHSSHHEIIQQNLSESLYHSRHLYQPESFIEWLTNKEVLFAFQLLSKRGASKYLISEFKLIRRIIAFDLLPEQYKAILIDMYHLRGEYEKAATAIESILSDSDSYDVFTDAKASRLYIRKIHHKMFYEPVCPLIEEMEAFYHKVKDHLDLETVNEIEFMLGGNLGVMTGDFDFSFKWLKTCISDCRKYGNHTLLVRALRKYGDALKGKGLYSKAKSVYDIGIATAETYKLERYAIYLNCCKGDALRLMGRYEDARSLLLDTRQRACNFNIVGWIAHCDLAIACLNMDQGVAFKKELKSALRIYQKINQQWGLQNLYIRVYAYYGNKEKIDGLPHRFEVKQSCKKLGYSYEVSILDSIKSVPERSFPLLFL
ncbi:hypothetical protein AB6C66_19020 [Vibrio splendidus]|uniref:hypothetical protein n=1 Tax=Vibrio splendidus TaxID=29497 RepID=UPI0003087099|nr:hypothetical protein [Vibrio splendidus]OEF77821.1 hypothetical protein A148_14965 [Vibrio splendidus 1F-157]PTP62745.1 hypothetical protein CWO23_20455 [Vibrio splendidus]